MVDTPVVATFIRTVHIIIYNRLLNISILIIFKRKKKQRDRSTYWGDHSPPPPSNSPRRGPRKTDVAPF